MYDFQKREYIENAFAIGFIVVLLSLFGSCMCCIDYIDKKHDVRIVRMHIQCADPWVNGYEVVFDELIDVDVNDKYCNGLSKGGDYFYKGGYIDGYTNICGTIVKTNQHIDRKIKVPTVCKRVQ